jgi:hypothetical protein
LQEGELLKEIEVLAEVRVVLDFLILVGCIPAPTMSPLSNPTGLPVSVQSYSITVGAGGAIASPPTGAGNPGNGNPSTFSSITSSRWWWISS